MNVPDGRVAPRAMLALFVLSLGVSFAVAQVRERTPGLAVPAAPPSARLVSEPTLASLQQQVQTLTTQVAALQSVLQVTSTGATLRAPTLTLLSIDRTEIRSSKAITIDAGTSLSASGGTTLSIRAAGDASMTGFGTLALKGATIRLNDATKPVATVGSIVGNGQVVSGSATILGN